MRVISLFSGCGGLDLGFKNAGFDIIWANDVFEDAADTYRNNIGDHIVVGDISAIPSQLIPDCDGVIGGFPCQGFSMANMGRTVDDQRNTLYLEFVRVVREKKPKFFVAENVKGILTLGKGAVFEKIKSDFAACGYEIFFKLFNAADYGVPQRRERVILFGCRSDLIKHVSIAFPPPPTHSGDVMQNNGLLRWVSCGSALKEIPEPDSPNTLPNHSGTKYKLRFNGYLGHRLVDPKKPAPTITARGDERGGVVIIHHPNNKRRLTVREAARIQSFPLNFVFSGNNTSGYRQIGNAVPPLFAQRIAESILKTFGFG
jgi:DNA (cytosine-5)-methyltransferase 1